MDDGTLPIPCMNADSGNLEHQQKLPCNRSGWIYYVGHRENGLQPLPCKLWSSGYDLARLAWPDKFHLRQTGNKEPCIDIVIQVRGSVRSGNPVLDDDNRQVKQVEIDCQKVFVRSWTCLVTVLGCMT